MKIDISEYDYKLPEEKIALYPAEPRSSSKLLVIDRARSEIEHRTFSDIVEYVGPKDVLVLNDSRVFPARLHGIKKNTGARVEIFLLRSLDNSHWEALVKPGRRLKPGTVVDLGGGNFTARIEDKTEVGGRVVAFSVNGNLMDMIWRYGEVPLPPYIARPPEEKDKSTYQTIYARNTGAVAAPTAGFHFTEEILEKLRLKGTQIAYLTLHPGLGTFRPITVADAAQHVMEKEYFSIPEATAEIVTTAGRDGQRIFAVGTTTVRALESSFDDNFRLRPAAGTYTDKFIYPPYDFKIVNCLLTNFHLPKSTLLLLVAAFAGKDRILAAYQEAIRAGYRFYSYGDAMLII